MNFPKKATAKRKKYSKKNSFIVYNKIFMLSENADIQKTQNIHQNMLCLFTNEIL